MTGASRVAAALRYAETGWMGRLRTGNSRCANAAAGRENGQLVENDCTCDVSWYRLGATRCCGWQCDDNVTSIDS
jgi:hypothetical protein